MLEKKNSIVMSGTPRTDSMYTVQSTRAIGIDDVRPSASNTPSGKLKGESRQPRIVLKRILPGTWVLEDRVLMGN